MKTFILVVALIFTANAFAGLGAFDSSEFNDIIKENAAAESGLREKLQKEVGVNPDLGPTGTIAKDKRDIVTVPSEHVAITSKESLWKDSPAAQKELLKADQKTLQRLSEEFDDSF